MTLTEILGCIGGGVIISLSGILLISWFKEWIVLFIKIWREERTSSKLDLNKLESKLDNALNKETTESLTKWIYHKRQNNMKQTAVDWLIEQMLKGGYFDGNTPLTYTNLDHLQQQAKEMEKGLMIEFAQEVFRNRYSGIYESLKNIADDLYNETYGE